MAGAEEAVICASLGERIPSGKSDYGAWGAERLGAAVDGPHYREQYEESSAGDAGSGGAGSEDSHTEVHQYADQKAGGHEAFDVGSVDEESVYKFSHSVCPVEAGADDTELGRRKETCIDNWLFHYSEGESADVEEGVCESSGKECLET